MSLFQWGDFTLHSGAKTWWRIDCDSLTDSEIELIAKLMYKKVGAFNLVTSPTSHPGSAVPRLVQAISKYSLPLMSVPIQCLIVDDVFTTGTSITEVKTKLIQQNHNPSIKGAVIFARGQCFSWVSPLFQYET